MVSRRRKNVLRTPSITNKNLRNLVQDIIAYIGLLEKDLEISVSLDQFERFFAPFIVDIRPYCFHNCSYCTYIRRLNPEIRATCSTRKNLLYGKLGAEPFFGTCWLGVGEYVFPILDGTGKTVGFVSNTGYRGDPEKTRAQTEKIVRRYQLDAEAIRAMQQTLKTDIPPMEQVRTRLMPLTHMFTLLYSFLEDYVTFFRDANFGKSRLFDDILIYLYNHIETHFRRSELAQLFSVSESTLNRMFKMYAGETYNSFINTMRFNIAQVYLSNTDLSVNDISGILGYSSTTYFSNAFKKKNGLSPEQYRRGEDKDKP